MIAVTMYSTGPDCEQCRATLKRFEAAAAVVVTVRDLSEAGTDGDREFVTSELGYSQAPVVVVDDEPEHHWSGFRPDLIDRLIAAQRRTASDAGPPVVLTQAWAGGARRGR
jgi:glutaredoxin-like protein NrdH